MAESAITLVAGIKASSMPPMAKPSGLAACKQARTSTKYPAQLFVGKVAL